MTVIQRDPVLPARKHQCTSLSRSQNRPPGFAGAIEPAQVAFAPAERGVVL
jgi:hypothetical protein